MTTRPILFVTHKKTNCGVYEFGHNVAEALRQARRFEYRYVECADARELAHAVDDVQPQAIIYNHHLSTMPWLTVAETRRTGLPQLGIIHEVTQRIADTVDSGLFDYTIASDPTLLLRNPRVFKTGRFIAPFRNTEPSPSTPTIGSFGFATPGKGFDRLVSRVNAEFDEAVIRLHIPFARFGDESGSRARGITEECQSFVTKPGIRLEVSHEFLSTVQLLGFLAQNSLNAFLYDDAEGRGISSVIDYALAVDRPLAVSTSSMFRHVHDARPGIVVGPSSLREIYQRGTEPLRRFREEWTMENLAWDYDRIVQTVLTRESAPANVSAIRAHRVARTTVAGSVKFASRAVRVSLRKGAPILSKVFPSGHVSRKIERLGTRVIRRLEWLASTRAGITDWIPREDAAVLPSRPTQLTPYVPFENPMPTFNRVLDDDARRDYRSAIEYLGRAAPAVIAKKIARANIQQAFVLDTVVRFVARLDRPRLLCVGSYEDTASLALIAGGHDVVELDPLVNYDITTFATKPVPGPGSYDVVFSTSVIEHVVEDEAFARACAEMLAPGGFAVFTCDFREDYRPGDPLPRADRRFYTTRDLLERVLPAMPGCRLVDEPSWDRSTPDFSFDDCLYSFATFVVEKAN